MFCPPPIDLVLLDWNLGWGRLCCPLTSESLQTPFSLGTGSRQHPSSCWSSAEQGAELRLCVAEVGTQRAQLACLRLCLHGLAGGCWSLCLRGWKICCQKARTSVMRADYFCFLLFCCLEAGGQIRGQRVSIGPFPSFPLPLPSGDPIFAGIRPAARPRFCDLLPSQTGEAVEVWHRGHAARPELRGSGLRLPPRPAAAPLCGPVPLRLCLAQPGCACGSAA